jgi:hypothetical protein
MIRLGIYLTLLLFVFVGCAEPVRYGWYNQQGSTNFNRDRYECTREAATVPQVALPSEGPPRYPTDGGFAAGFQYGQAAGAYNDAVAQAEGQQALAARLFAMCMQNRGYELRPVSSPSSPTPSRVTAEDPQLTADTRACYSAGNTSPEPLRACLRAKGWRHRVEGGRVYWER